MRNIIPPFIDAPEAPSEPLDIVLPDARFEMPELLVPRRRPIGPVEIDWSNPLTRGLGIFALYGHGDLVKGFPETRFVRGYGGPYNEGKASATQYSGFDRGYWPDIETATEVTVTFWASNVQQTPYFALGGYNHSQGSSQYSSLSIALSQRLNQAYTQSGAFTVLFEPMNTSYVQPAYVGFNYTTATDLPFQDGGWHIVSVAIPTAAVDGELTCVDGKEYSHTDYTRINDISSATEFVPNNQNCVIIGGTVIAGIWPPSNGGDAYGSGWMVHNRLLSLSEMVSLHKNHYQFLIPA